MVASLRFSAPVVVTMYESLPASSDFRKFECAAPETSRWKLWREDLSTLLRVAGLGDAAVLFSWPGKQAVGGVVESCEALPESEVLNRGRFNGLLGEARCRAGCRDGVDVLEDFAERNESLVLGRNGVRVSD